MADIKLSRVDLEMILTWNTLTVSNFGSNDELEEALVLRLKAWRDDMEARGDD